MLEDQTAVHPGSVSCKANTLALCHHSGPSPKLLKSQEGGHPGQKLCGLELMVKVNPECSGNLWKTHRWGPGSYSARAPRGKDRHR